MYALLYTPQSNNVNTLECILTIYMPTQQSNV